MIESDLTLRDGRTLHVYDTGAPELADPRLVVVWHHGTPNIGPPPAPLLAESARLGVRWLGFDRPGYGGSTRHPGRTTGSVARDVAELVDALSVERFAVVGHSGGGSHAVASVACSATGSSPWSAWPAWRRTAGGPGLVRRHGRLGRRRR